MTWLVPLALLMCIPPPGMTSFQIEPARDYRVADLPVDLSITAVDAAGAPVTAYCGTAQVSGLARDGAAVTEVGPFVGGKASLTAVRPRAEVTVRDGDAAGAWRPALRTVPGWLSIIPPIFAILLAILVREALIALFAGLWIGALFIHGYNPLTALLRCFDTYLPQTLADSDHAAIVLFTMALGGMVGVISRSGGTKALVDAIAARATSRRSGMLTAWGSGLVVFFDDYANCLLVGNTVRPFTDRLGVSREKLAYIVDSTAAPVATVALVSTWIGFQIGEFEGALGTDAYGWAGRGYELFLHTLPYSFYSFFTIAFVLAIAVTLRDFGPMARAERRALHDGHLVRPGAQPLMDSDLTDAAPHDPARAHWMTALIPIAAVLLIVVVGLYVSGVSALGDAAAGAGLREIIAASNSYAVLLWASFGGSVIALAAALWRRSITFGAAMEAWMGGVRAMVVAVLILVSAWALGTMCKDALQTGAWIISQINPSPHWLPFITFTVCSLIALATGSSFSTMAIVIPIAAPLAWTLTGADSGLSAGVIDSIRYATLAAVLSGAVFGDHCSPISDTTIMSSMSSASDHVDHVRTQAPYAILCAAVAGVVGFLPAGWGVSPMITMPLGIAILIGVLRAVGTPLANTTAAAGNERLGQLGKAAAGEQLGKAAVGEQLGKADADAGTEPPDDASATAAGPSDPA